MVIKNKIIKILNNKIFQKLEKWFLVIFWAGAIYYLSSKPLNFFIVADVWELILRKFAHIFEFGVFAFLIFRILGQTEKRHINWNLFWTFIFTVLYAVSDEYHQSFVAGRTGAYTDILVDSIGVIIAIWLIYLNYQHKKLLKK